LEVFMPPPKSVLPATWDLPAEFRARVGEKVGRQRAMVADDHLLLVLHRPPRASDDERVGRFLWRKPDGSWQSSDLGNGATVLTRHLGEFSELVEQFGHDEDEAAGISEYYNVLDGMTPVHRAIRNLHAALQEAREQIPGDRDLINARDRAYDLERMADLLLGDVRNALQFTTARKAEEQAVASHQMAVSAHRLNMLVAFFFPLATLTAIFGTNLTHPLEKFIPPPYAFFGVISTGAVLGALLAGYLLGVSREHVTQQKKPTSSESRR
jgi:hypothetical protein